MALGATRGAVLTQFMLDIFDKLEKVTSLKQTTKQSSRTKIPARKKTRARK